MGHLVDPPGRRQQGSAGEGRSEGCHGDFLALGGWRRGGTACTSGSAVRFGCHLVKMAVWRTLIVAGPRKHLERKMTRMVEESTLNLKVILHGYFVQDHPPHFDKGSAV